MRSCGGLYGQYPQGALLTYMDLQVTSASLCHEARREGLGGREGKQGSDAIGTLHVAHFVPFEKNHLGFFTIFDGDFAKYIQDFADKTRSFSTRSFHTALARRQPQ